MLFSSLSAAFMLNYQYSNDDTLIEILKPDAGQRVIDFLLKTL